MLPVAVERYTYEVAEWGVGEVAAQGACWSLTTCRAPRFASRRNRLAKRLPNHTQGNEPPEITLAADRARVRAKSVPDFVSGFVERVRRQLGGAETTYSDIGLDLSLVHAVSGRARSSAARRPVGRGRELRRVGRARWPAGCAAGCGLVLRPEPLRARHAVPPGGRRDGHRRVRRIWRRSQTAPPRAGGSRTVTDSTRTFAADVRAELAAIAPTRRCDRLAELSALFHAAGNLHLRGRGEVTLHLDVATSSVARRAFALLRGLEIDSEIRTYRAPRFRPGDTLSAACRWAVRRHSQCSSRRVSSIGTMAAVPPAETTRPSHMLPRCIPPRCVPCRRLGVAPTLASPRAADCVS